MSKEIIVKNISEYIVHVNSICQDDSNGTFRYFFRGENNDRKGKKNMPSVFLNQNLLENEHILIKEAISRFPEIYGRDMSTFQKLVRMRHYELPVRLLDISSSPLVSLYFACAECDRKDVEEKDKDGFVYIFKRKKTDIKYYDSDNVCVLSNLAHMDYDFNVSRKGHLLHKIKEDRPDFYELFGDNLSELNDKCVCVIPQYNNDRVKIQQGAFFLLGLHDGKKCALNVEHDVAIRIPNIEKKDILNNLKILGYENSKLFPEELEVFRTLKAEYNNK